MANEFKHKDPCSTLTQAEYISACGDGHIFACQATGDIVYASSTTVLSKLAKGAANTVLHMGGSCIPAWTASPSVTDLTIGGGCITLTGAATDIDLIDNNASALSFDASGQAGILEIVTTDCSEAVKLAGILDVNSSIDFDGTTVAACASGAITLTSTSSSACGIYLRANGGTSETVKIHSDQGTSVTEGAASVSLLSDAGGVELRSTADLANAINITNDGGTSGTITLFNDQGTSVTEGAASIALVSDAGGVELRSTANLANAINITNDGGTSGTITLFNDQGTSVTEGAASIELLSDAGGVELRSTANLANAINLTSDGGTAGTITLFNDQGTAVNEGVASIQVLSDVGGIGIKSGLNAAGAIRLTADAGTSETIVLHADQGSGTGSICLTSDAGGITLNPGTFVSVGGIADAEIRLFEDTGAGCNYAAIKVQNMSASYTLTLPADDGCCGEALTTNGSGVLTWAAGASGPSQADQAALECETNEDTYAPPDMIKFSPGVAKAWARWEMCGAHGLLASYNMTSATDGGAVGDSDLLFATDFSSANYSIVFGGFVNGKLQGKSAAAGGLTVEFESSNATSPNVDTDFNNFAAFGDQ